jgi:hypothetical protein
MTRLVAGAQTQIFQTSSCLEPDRSRLDFAVTDHTTFLSLARVTSPSTWLQNQGAWVQEIRYDSRRRGIDGFLASIASDAISPASGSAVKVTGAMGAALCEMTCLHLLNQNDVGGR